MKGFFKLLIAQTLIFCCLETFGQNYPVYNSYPTNPYLYNPAEAASEYTFVYINHRQQWTGLDGAPQLSTLNFNTLLDHMRVGIGAKVSSYKRGLLNTTDAQATFAYGIPLGKNDALYFGLSGGVISNSLDQNKVIDPTDPAIANYLSNNMQAIGNAGFVYKGASGINFGVSLPQFISQKPSVDGLSAPATINPFDQILITAYYKKKLESRFVTRTVKGMRTRTKAPSGNAPLEFYLTYKMSAYQNSQFEGLIKINLSESIWLGGGYRQQYGFIANAGLNIKQFALAYSFEPGNQPESNFSSGTHEIQLGFRFGEQKLLKKKAVVLRSTLKTNTSEGGTRLKHSVSDIEKEEEVEEKAKNQHGKRFLVVIKVFNEFTQAEDFKRKLIDQKFNAEIFYYAKDKKFYVHVLESTKQQEANEEVRNLKNYSKLKDAKVVVVIE